MLRRSKPTFSKNMDRDVVLCRTVSKIAGNRTCERLVRDSISFSRRWVHIPFFFQSRLDGMNELLEIQVNRNDYTSARKALDRLDPIYKKRIAVNLL